MFAKHNVVYMEVGENEGTLEPICSIENFNGDLNETRKVCVSFDNDMRIEVSKYQVKEVWLPAWLSVEDWVKNLVSYKFLWSYHKKAAEMSEIAQRALITLQGEYAYWVVQLVSSTTRTAFRSNIKEQVLAWCEKKLNNQTTYAQPLSMKQLNCIKGATWSYKSVSNGVSRSYNGVEMVGA